MRFLVPGSLAVLPARLLASLLSALLVVAPIAAQTGDSSPSQPKSSSAKSTGTKSTAKKTTGAKKTAGKSHARTTRASSRRRKRRPSARAIRIKRAFVASAELRPMAQQLANLRTPAAYEGVTRYAHEHTGDAAAAAYLALGHAYLTDRRFAEATSSLHQARQASDVLADYADFLSARSEHEAGNEAGAEALLHGFAQKYPTSVFVVEAPELEATVLLGMHDTTGAQRALAEAEHSPAADRPGYQLARGEVAQALGQADEADRIYKDVLLTHPLSPEAEIARAKLTASGAEASLTATELRSLGDAYYNGGRYALAGEQYHALARQPGLPEQERQGFAVAAAACDLKLKRLTTAEAEALPDTADDNGARRAYLLMELARSRNDESTLQNIVAQMETRFPESPWLAEALFSSGNMYLLSRDYPKAIEYYGYLAAHFPQNKNAAAAHWRAGWLSYRQGLYPDAERIFDEQVRLYPSAAETVAALYWRARLYETQDHKPSEAVANYHAIVRAYQHYFYAQMARQRLSELGTTVAVAEPEVDSIKAPDVPPLDDSFPEDSEHLAKARLLANAGMNEYIPREIAADPDSGSWSALAEAQIYASFGETYRALRALKRALPYAATASIDAIPLVYWRILFPEPYWETIKVESAKNNLDPYLVASLIRQESEFNPAAVSYANAWGLMQLLPSVGRAMAREEGITHFETFQLLDPETNIRLGTRYLRHMLDRFGGVQEYALAAYNAGDERVADWEAAGPYHGMDEFVESIPFTQTREYVEAILRNIETYRAIDSAADPKGKAATGR
ncbi:MAG TPA: transglycosylase SLT domain-containing protein [Terracidiphilus sp.]|nr:transglycosylase SLT domain-containing protein [Terracidiphilus sp.]